MGSNVSIITGLGWCVCAVCVETQRLTCIHPCSLVSHERTKGHSAIPEQPSRRMLVTEETAHYVLFLIPTGLLLVSVPSN